jgi:hypothetical protein
MDKIGFRMVYAWPISCLVFRGQFLKQSWRLRGKLAPTQQWRSAQLAPTEKIGALQLPWCQLTPMLVLKTALRALAKEPGRLFISPLGAKFDPRGRNSFVRGIVVPLHR